MALLKFTFTLIFLIVALLHIRVEARPQQNFAVGGAAGGLGQPGNEFSPPMYTYSYEAVDAQSGNQFGHGEKRDGGVTQGEYRVLMPNGVTKIVRYTVDGDSGFQAEVTYEGGNQRK